MDDWDVRPLGEVCTIKPPKAEARARLADGDEVSFAPMEDMGIGVKYLQPLRTRLFGEVSGSYTYFADGDVLLAKITPCFENGKLGVARGLTNGIGFGSSEFIVLRPNPTLDAEFLYYYLARPTFLDEGARTMTGAVGHKRVTKAFIYGYPIPLPPLLEQRRIVAILDKAFDSIATAKANAEKNLQNARKLFESALDAALSHHRGGFTETTLGDEIDLVAGYNFPSRGYTDAANGIRLLRGDNIMQGYLRWSDAKGWPATDIASYSRFALQEDDVVLAMDRPWVKAGLKRAQIGADDLPCLQLQRTARLRPMRGMSVGFLYHLTGSKSFSRHLIGVQTGLGVPHISGKQIESFRFMLPPQHEQETIADTLNNLQHCSEHLEEVYQQKISALDKLKKAFLYQAFTGQLTSTKEVSVTATPSSKTTSPEFSATIIALAYAQHIRQQRERTFGRVKEQKLLHLVEAIGKVDLGRQPMKDAAGPNDFSHMLKAEDWAKRNNFFELTQRDEGYDFKRLLAFDKLLASAPQVLGSNIDRIKSVIDLILTMDKEEVEVFATVHAAWNNLLIDGTEVTDEAIVREARDGWHADKLAIPEVKFRQAIALIRSKGLVPDGSGRYVGGQRPLAFR